MSEYFTTYAGYPVRDVAAAPLREMLQIMIAEADYVMGAQLDDGETVTLIRWLIEFLYDKYGYLPFNHVRTAFKAGSVGQRGGTSKLIPRNIVIWLTEQDKIYQEQHAASQRKADDQKKQAEIATYKPDGFVAAAVRMKVTWLIDRRITSEQYDSFSSKAIHDLLRKGVSEKDIHPRDVVPNYQNMQTI